jgi:transcriptional regulator with GAF, ATPase, and Fis domain
MQDEIRTGLAAMGIDCTSFEQIRGGPRYGIVCFTEMTNEVLALLHRANQQLCRVLAVALSNATSVPPAWRLLDAGASDILTWDRSGSAALQISVKLKRWSEVDDMVDEILSRGFLVGRSRVWLGLVRRIVEAAHFGNAPILLTGESGTGKELLARLVSFVTCSVDDGRAPRKDLVTVDCGALVPELSGSEFFGHERGAFTGAHVMREGAFALADGATLLLDEIGDISLSLQPQILRSIQEGTYKRLGSNTWQNTRFRLVSATNRDLKDMTQHGKFRLDLYYRIAGCIFRTPTLQERREDILPLASHFLGEFLAHEAPDFDTHVRDYLLNRAYPGNVRELRQLIQRIASRYPGAGPITAGDLPEEDRPASGNLSRAWPDDRFEQSIVEAIALGTSLRDITRTATQMAARIAVEREDGNVRRAAKRLGITERALQMRRASDRLGRDSNASSVDGTAGFVSGQALPDKWPGAFGMSPHPQTNAAAAIS